MDVKKILADCGIDYTEHHPKVSKNCVGVDCPFCGHGNKYLGIFMDTGFYSCWACGAKGSLFKLINRISGMSWDEYSAIAGVSKFRVGEVGNNLNIIFRKEEVARPEVDTEELREVEKFLIPATKANIERIGRANGALPRYLSKRTFTSRDMLNFGLSFSIAGPMINRLVIPIPAPFISERPLGYLGRDFTERAGAKYLATKSLNLRSMVYQNDAEDPDTRNGILVIVEGVFDSWAFRLTMAQAIFGKVLHRSQINHITRLADNYPHLVICMDGEAQKDARKVRDELSPYFKTANILRLPSFQDPSSLGPDKMDRLVYDFLNERLRKEKHGTKNYYGY